MKEIKKKLITQQLNLIRSKFFQMLTLIVFSNCGGKKTNTIQNDSEAMSNTLLKGAKYKFISTLVYNRNDIVAFKNIDFLSGKPKVSIMRIIGISGDTIKYFEGIPYVNNTKVYFPPTSKRFYSANVESINDLTLFSKNIIYQTTDTIILNIDSFQKVQIGKLSIGLSEFSSSQKIKSSFLKFKANNSHDFFEQIIIPKSLTPIDSNNVLYNGYWNTVLQAEKCYFLVGDNVQETFDSRYFGLVPHSYIIGKLSPR